MPKPVVAEKRPDESQPVQPAAAKPTTEVETPKDLRLTILQFFVCYAPERLTEIPSLMRSYSERPIDLVLELRRQFNQTPVEKEAQLCVKNDIRTRMFLFYARYNPAKLDDIDDILDKYIGMEGLLWAALEAKYGPELPLHSLYEDWNRTLPPAVPPVPSTTSLPSDSSSPLIPTSRRQSDQTKALPSHTQRFANVSGLAPASVGGMGQHKVALESDPSRADFDYSDISSESAVSPMKQMHALGSSNSPQRRTSAESGSALSPVQPEASAREVLPPSAPPGPSEKAEYSKLLRKLGVVASTALPLASEMPRPAPPLPGSDRSSAWHKVMSPDDFQRL